ncbi:endo-1,4-beta-xylanase 5-like [Lycium barbarum]|uniref:endo-1,4-beta-xylanase 5-like n=1 Tax=Lycium barbarum TaxID=112863 RepID=UPI00293EE95F|nr:endo-1,4-beta-xylanase 5-like [Lycium barbarum]XP_060216851.1 endo-1,4-beta-xylanase 5-like [Lycium barbarum]XP_060216853.1 endo-1,4-beta-xylanase 5-like [Lycium barbarum]XP_060216854.1 endo-1,4-beta-xylanase 5-like [Lycium barbarum]XP_060216855.1 endo-1,4-beta-xylanase 5-like [Lycium barbarum]XP_060216856.1 endo-1,4-beta-xylanase 5-like [Lycium barbarum]
MSPRILNNPAYRDWHNSRFKWTIFENELKWHINEATPGNEDYSLADAMHKFAKKNDMVVRGHTIIWENPRWLPSWVLNMSKTELSAAIGARFNSIMNRYKGQFIHWDVDNENLHYEFLDNKLGEKNVTASFYNKAHKIDEKPLLFLNEFGTIEQHRDRYATPARYLQKIRKLRSNGHGGPLGIGLQGHFDTPNLPHIRSAIDILASANLPIWITELDVSTRPNQEMYLDQILRELHAHPAVKGIMIWSPWQPQGCYKMCLTDNSFQNLPSGNIVDKFMQELSNKGFQGNTDSNGYLKTSLFHGDYQAKISHPTIL